MHWIKYMLCRVFGRHYPSARITNDGWNRVSHCMYCHKKILQDSWGKWFRADKAGIGDEY